MFREIYSLAALIDSFPYFLLWIFHAFFGIEQSSEFCIRGFYLRVLIIKRELFGVRLIDFFSFLIALQNSFWLGRLYAILVFPIFNHVLGLFGEERVRAYSSVFFGISLPGVSYSRL